MTSLLQFMKDPLKVVAEAAHGQEDVVLLLRRPFKLYLAIHPDSVKDVLVTHSRDFALGPVRRWVRLALGEGLLTSEGERHIKEKRSIQPAFHLQRVKGYGETMTSYTSRHVERWKDGDVIDAGEEMRELTLRIVVSALFGSEVPHAVDRISSATNTMEEYLAARSRNPLGLLLHKAPLPLNLRFHKARALVDEIVYGHPRVTLVFSQTTSRCQMLHRVSRDATVGDKAPLPLNLRFHKARALVDEIVYGLIAEQHPIRLRGPCWPGPRAGGIRG